MFQNVQYVSDRLCQKFLNGVGLVEVGKSLRSLLEAAQSLVHLDKGGGCCAKWQKMAKTTSHLQKMQNYLKIDHYGRFFMYECRGVSGV